MAATGRGRGRGRGLLATISSDDGPMRPGYRGDEEQKVIVMLDYTTYTSRAYIN